MDIPASNKPIGFGPKTRVCYICGRQYSLHSFEIHIKQCKELWLAREAQKDPRERRKLPEDPLERLQSGGMGMEDSITTGSPGTAGTASPAGGAVQLSRKELEELNKLSNDAYNTETLETCLYCGRTFLPEKLAIHNRSCTADSPARRVTDKVRRGNEVPTVSGINDTASSGLSEKTPSRPKTTNSVNPRSSLSTPSKDSLMRRSRGNEENSDNDSSNNERGDEGTPNLKVQDGALVGHLGGSSGRNIRGKPPIVNRSSPSPLSKPSNVEAILDGKDKNEVISLLSNRVDFMESTIFDLSQSITEVRAMLSKLKEL